MSFTNKVVIVTGGSSGIGAATAIHFAKEGAQVAIVGRSEAKLNDVAAQISKVGKAPLIIKADVSTDDVKTIVKKTVDKFGRLDVLVNNAGIANPAAVEDENLLEVYDKVMNTNLRSAVALTNLSSSHLIKTKGNIVNISSIAGTLIYAGNPSYAISKAGMDHFTRIAAMELAPKGVRVNAVSPGPVETPILETSDQGITWDQMKEMTALKVVAQPNEVAELISYLASDRARCVTGSNYVIDGGVLVA